MKGKGIRTLAIAGLLMAAMVAAVMPAEAKTYYTVSAGTTCEHTAVRYANSDIVSSLQRYVDKIEYDLKYTSGSCGFGVRLYLTEEGRKNIEAGNSYLLKAITLGVMNAPEWMQERTFQSVQEEIRFHSANLGRRISGIEYHYEDLKFNEYWKYI